MGNNSWLVLDKFWSIFFFDEVTFVYWPKQHKGCAETILTRQSKNNGSKPSRILGYLWSTQYLLCRFVYTRNWSLMQFNLIFCTELLFRTFGILFFPDCPLYPSWDNPSSILVCNSCSSLLPTKQNLNYLPGHCSCYVSEVGENPP